MYQEFPHQCVLLPKLSQTFSCAPNNLNTFARVKPCFGLDFIWFYKNRKYYSIYPVSFRYIPLKKLKVLYYSQTKFQWNRMSGCSIQACKNIYPSVYSLLLTIWVRLCWTSLQVWRGGAASTTGCGKRYQCPLWHQKGPLPRIVSFWAPVLKSKARIS